MICYFVPLKPGRRQDLLDRPRTRSGAASGTGMENHAKYGDSDLLPRRRDALWVNLFIASELTGRRRACVCARRPRFPDEASTTLKLACAAPAKPARFALRLRHPAWAKDGFAVSVNGHAEPVESRPSSYATVEREWRDGDVVEIRLPMSLRFEPTPDDPARGAFLFGPIVLAADLGAEGLDARARYGPSAPEVHLEELPPAPVLVAASAADALARVKPAPGSLHFRTEGLGLPADVVLRPFFRLADRRYSVYFDVLTRADWAEQQARTGAAARARAVIDARTVDSVEAGRPESEKARDLEEKGSDAWSLEGRRCRSARYGDRLLPPPPRGESRGAASRLLGRRVAPPRLRGRSRGRDDRHAVALRRPAGRGAGGGVPTPRAGSPAERSALRVGFRTGPGTSTGAVFEVRIVRPVSPAP